MSELLSPFEGKTDFNKESFYYFLPSFNLEKKNEIGEKITKFKGVSIYIYIYHIIYKLIYYIYINFIFLLQLISFSLKENINILINKQYDLFTEKFKQEILLFGNVYFYAGEKIHFIKCLNKQLLKPDNFKCFEVEGKKKNYILFHVF